MGIIWFEHDLVLAGHRDWRLTDADGTRAAYAELLTDGRFAGILDPKADAEPLASSVAAMGAVAAPPQP